jgi:hypothetical protein
MKTLPLLALLPLSAGCVAEELDTSTTRQPLSIIEEGPGCAELGLGDSEVRVEAPFAASYFLDPSTVQVGFDAEGIFFYVSSDGLRFDGVLAHAGGRTAVWDFGREESSWGSMFAPIDVASGAMQPPEAISFCYDHDLWVRPNAYGAYGRRHHWAIAQTGGASGVALGDGETFVAGHDVTVTLTGVEDAGYEISGPIFIQNFTPTPTTLTAVSVDAGGVAATVTCPPTLPWVIQPGVTLICDYIAEVPDGADRTVTATVSTSDGLPGGAGATDASFSQPGTGTTLLDECIDVSGGSVGHLGTVCAPETSASFHYDEPLGPFECGAFEALTTASFTAHDTGVTATASSTSTGEVACDAACTQPSSYWRTTTSDPAWSELPDGTATPFFLSGTTHHGALTTNPGGNPYWYLARAYIAAKLNHLAGADLAAVQGVYNQATTLLSNHTPTQVRNGNLLLKARVTLYALALDAYNHGLVGPGACD